MWSTRRSALLGVSVGMLTAFAAVTVLAGCSGERAARRLVRDLDSPSRKVRLNAGERLVALGPPAVPALIEAIETGSDTVKYIGAQILGRISDPRAADALIVNVFEGGKTPMLPASELETMGLRLGIYPSQTHRAAIRAAQRVLAALKADGDTGRIEAELATFQEREDAVGTDRWRALEEKYLRSP